jgi:hypothetical protein
MLASIQQRDHEAGDTQSTLPTLADRRNGEVRTKSELALHTAIRLTAVRMPLLNPSMHRQCGSMRGK